MIKPFSIVFVNTFLELPHEGVDADDGEDKPEDNTHSQHIEDTGKSSDEGVHHDLHPLHLGHGSQRTQSPQCPHRLENWDISSTEQTGSEVDERHGDNDFKNRGRNKVGWTL